MAGSKMMCVIPHMVFQFRVQYSRLTNLLVSVGTLPKCHEVSFRLKFWFVQINYNIPQQSKQSQ